MKPLQPLIDSGLFQQSNSPRLIIVDGLDECLDRVMQQSILDLFSQRRAGNSLPFVFLVASRPEHDIRATFNSPKMRNLVTNLVLDDTYLPDQDIELFLRDRFLACKNNHPFKKLIPYAWPTDQVIERLVSKSSGQFIYAATVVKYVTSTRHRPHHRLEVVLAIRPASRDLPFSELDAFYTHIFSSVEDLDQVLHIISFDIIFRNMASVDSIERVLGLETGEVSLLFCDLASIIDLRYDPYYGVKLHFLHASLTDFLLDPMRSRSLHINVAAECSKHACHCCHFLSGMFGIRTVLQIVHLNSLSILP